jgi:zinc resistance-associated protein
VTQNTPTEIQALRDEADGLSRRADDLKKIADAAQPLFASLDDPQRRQLMTFIRSNEAEAQGVKGSYYRGRR